MAKCVAFLVVLLLVGLASAQLPEAPSNGHSFTDKDFFELALNLEYLEAEFYLKSVYGYGVEGVDKKLTGGGPNSKGGKIASLSSDIQAVAEMFALQEVGHIRIIREYLKKEKISRPLVDIDGNWQVVFKAATNNVITDFDPYANDANWLLAAYVLPYVGLTAYVGTNPLLRAKASKQLLAGVLGIEGGQDAVLRTLLWLRRSEVVAPYNKTIAELTGDTSLLRDKLASTEHHDENIVVSKHRGAEGRIKTNILSANADSLSFARNAYETLRIMYGNGNEGKPGGFYPEGAHGYIAEYFLKKGSA
eukprot:TRINITY_DN6934_c0_g1_i2.p1 TRINITY_DN6934_c0_g1~~TRINITY_DN6934_c0_g1_i2.p1  ORF type:complete len:305 (-),score=52.48 TRINITY_DN6934_c0_g1_i2:513-1427(-)